MPSDRQETYNSDEEVRPMKQLPRTRGKLGVLTSLYMLTCMARCVALEREVANLNICITRLTSLIQMFHFLTLRALDLNAHLRQDLIQRDLEFFGKFIGDGDAEHAQEEVEPQREEGDGVSNVLCCFGDRSSRGVLDELRWTPLAKTKHSVESWQFSKMTGVVSLAISNENDLFHAKVCVGGSFGWGPWTSPYRTLRLKVDVQEKADGAKRRRMCFQG
ncbi:hypothetical protein IWZ01DRAFT_486054 [Phyllosticta capitalensis]